MRGNLSRVADVGVGQRFLTPAEPGRLTEAEELASLAGVTGNLTGPNPSTASRRLSALAVSPMLAAVAASRL